MKRSCLIPVVVLVLAAGCLIAAGIGYLLLAQPAAPPIVMIDSPRNGERVAVNQETVIHAVARSDQKIKRVELWVNGALQDAQTSSVPGGVSPFPIVVSWRPPISGTHSIIVRAFSMQNARGFASIDVAAQTSGDRDNDSVPDVIDGCPDQPGLAPNNGCPAQTAGDRDGDGIPDANDACADQPGTTLANGCPDADDDGVPDGVDACPREFGSAASNGCPAPGDADGDGVADASDACPREAGLASLGGCPDRDGDGVRDAEDACPDDAGVPGAAGCPDRDGDGVRDALDLCTTVPGPSTNSGCPVGSAGDSDGDGVRDDTDLAPGEAGSADSGGAPPPGGGSDSDSDGAPDAEEAAEDPLSFLGLFFGYAMTFTDVEIQALEFQVNDDYTSVSCYASVGNNAAERIGPFAPLSARRWDIAAFMGPLNSRKLLAPAGQPLQVRVECGGIAGGARSVPGPGGGGGEGGGDEAYFDLGSITRSHDISGTTVQEMTADSSGGSSGHTFRVKYRVCSPACEMSALRAPMITLVHVGGENVLAWAWAGHAYDINGFKLYMNGNYMFGVDEHSTNYRFHDVPPCGHRFDIQLSAYRGNPHRPDAESPLSNIVTWEGAPCPTAHVTVTFTSFVTGDLGSNDGGLFVGPLFGSFWVNDQREDFDSHYRVRSNHNHDIAEFFPRNQFSVDLERDDWLTIGATIKDRDPGTNPNEVLFDNEENLSPDQIQIGERRLMSGNSIIVVRISVASSASVVSDRNIKSNVSAVNPRDVLARLAQIPISTWNYNSDDPAVRHIGVMAQDFYAAFGVGETDTRIMQVDADGVAFAAIQGLYQMVQERDAQIAALQKQNATLEARITALEQRSGNQPLTPSLSFDTFLPWLIVGVAGGIWVLRQKYRRVGHDKENRM